MTLRALLSLCHEARSLEGATGDAQGAEPRCYPTETGRLTPKPRRDREVMK